MLKYRVTFQLVLNRWHKYPLYFHKTVVDKKQYFLGLPFSCPKYAHRFAPLFMLFKNFRGLFLGLALLPLAARAQNELSNFTATGRGGVSNTFSVDYQSLGINPANLGRPGNAMVAFSFAEVGIGVNSQSLTKAQLKKFIYKTDEKLTKAEKQLFAQAFTNDNAFNLNADLTTFAVSVHLPLMGGIAFSNRQRITSHIGLNQNAADILFLGKNAPVIQQYYPTDSTLTVPEVPKASEVLDGTKVQMQWLNEYNVAYGIKVFDGTALKLYGGLGYKYIQGIAVVDVVAENGKVEGYSALTPNLNTNYGNLINNPDFNYQSEGKGWLKPVGYGHGFDIGFSAEAGKKVRVGLSVTDIGYMQWTGNLITATDDTLREVTTEGISTFNLFSEAADIFGAGQDSVISYHPAEVRRVSLPTRLRTGAGFRLSDRFEAGLDVTIPLNNQAGNLPAPFVGLGVDFKPHSLLRLSSGMTFGAGYSANLPLGITLVTSVYEAGIGTRDVIGWFSDKNPYFSVAFGFLRFKIPQPMAKLPAF
jgi:hypothetical protein